MEAKAKSIFITGDLTIDYYTVLGNRPISDAPKQVLGCCNTEIKGGAYLIYDFLSAFGDSNKNHFGLGAEVFKHLPSQNKSYGTLAMFQEGADKKSQVWRIGQQFGFGSFTHGVDFTKAVVDKDTSAYDIVIIDDAGMDFGSHINKDVAWPTLESLTKPGTDKKRAGLVIVKKSGDIRKGELLKELLDASGKGNFNLLTILSINEIRRQEARVSSNISWEQTAIDLVGEMHKNIHLKSLLQSRFIVVTFQSSGAVIIINKGDGLYDYRLVFDPLFLENEWEMKLEGTVIGRMSCFTAALASAIEMNGKNFNLEEAVAIGLKSVRTFFQKGYPLRNNKLLLPLEAIHQESVKASSTYSRANIPDPLIAFAEKECKWRILADNYDFKEEKEKKNPNPLYNLARNIVINGNAALANIPSLSLGKLFTVDRDEIESLRNIKKQMESYRDQKKADIPLSIAVFGMPGSGKSFGVKELAIGVLGEKASVLEFNLSQFSGSSDLIGAFHQVRDEVLKGGTPLVFWDEFDSENLKWLQFLLAPMQDGTFQEGQIKHNIGKCIMVFAGGTCYTMEEFGNYDSLKDKGKFDNFKQMKGPDFKSRINGYLNVIGPNPGEVWNKNTSEWEKNPEDICYPIRRALFIRQILGLKDNDKPEIEWGLLNALLKVDKYKHGSRSMVNILKALKENSVGRKILRSHLPSDSILQLHVETLKSFLDHLNEKVTLNEHVFAIAPFIHKNWQIKSEAKNPEYDIEYSMLPVFLKASNIDAASRIPDVLGAAKLRIVSDSDVQAMTEDEYSQYLMEHDKKHLEQMAEKEHELWMSFYEQNDWHYNGKRDDYKKLHNCMVEYSSGKLSDGDKNKDRDQVCFYWTVLKDAGLGIAKE